MNRKNYARVIARIKAMPQRFRQSSVPTASCGSSYCFMGHAEALYVADTILAGEPATAIQRSDGFDVDTFEPVRKWLGISQAQQSRLFDGQNTLKDFIKWGKSGRIPSRRKET